MGIYVVKCKGQWARIIRKQETKVEVNLHDY
jgi:hypothetical protein